MTIKETWLHMAELWRHPSAQKSGLWTYYSVMVGTHHVSTLFEHVEVMRFFKQIDADQLKEMKGRLTDYFLAENVPWVSANGELPHVGLCVNFANTTREKVTEEDLGGEEDL